MFSKLMRLFFNPSPFDYISKRFNIDLSKSTEVKDDDKSMLWVKKGSDKESKASYYKKLDVLICKCTREDIYFVRDFDRMDDRIISEVVNFVNLMELLKTDVSIVNKHSDFYYLKNGKIEFFVQNIKFNLFNEKNPLSFDEFDLSVIYKEGFTPKTAFYKIGSLESRVEGYFGDPKRLSKSNLLFQPDYLMSVCNQIPLNRPQFRTGMLEDELVRHIKITLLNRHFSSWEEFGIPLTEDDAEVIKMLNY